MHHGIDYFQIALKIWFKEGWYITLALRVVLVETGLTGLVYRSDRLVHVEPHSAMQIGLTGPCTGLTG
jgi:hypothetical protein